MVESYYELGQLLVIPRLATQPWLASRLSPSLHGRSLAKPPLYDMI